MTDARFPERWLNDRRLLRLPDDAFRLFVMSLAWSVANKTDGVIYDDDLSLIPSPGTSPDPGQLVTAGLWERVTDYWLIGEFEETQTTSADLAALAAARRKARDKKRRQRAAVPGDVPGDTTRTGQARTGQALRPKVKSTTDADEVRGERVDHEVGDSPAANERADAVGEGLTAPPQSRKTTGITTARANLVPDDQQQPSEVHLQSQAEGGNARASATPARADCPSCGASVSVMANGKLRPHGPRVHVNGRFACAAQDAP